MAHKYVKTMEALASSQDLRNEWVEVDQRHLLTGLEEHRCACSHALTYGTTLISKLNGRALIMGSTCLKNFKGETTGTAGDGCAVTLGVFIDIDDVDGYSAAVLRGYLAKKSCSVCGAKAERLRWCGRCGGIPRCTGHQSDDCAACEQARMQKEAAEKAEKAEKAKREALAQKQAENKLKKAEEERQALAQKRAEYELKQAEENEAREEMARNQWLSLDPDTLMCARCHQRVNERDRCDNDAHNWYPFSRRTVTHREVLAGIPKIVD